MNKSYAKYTIKKSLYAVLVAAIVGNAWGYVWIDPKTKIKWQYHYSLYGEYTSSPRWEIELGSEGLPAIDPAYQGHLVVPSVIDGKELHYLSGSSHCGAFQGCSRITSVDLPVTLREVSLWAFRGCTSLSAVNISSGVRVIENEAFAGCRSLKRINIPEGVVEIGWDAFSGCENLESVSLPSTLKRVGGDAFNGCNELKEIVVRSDVELMGKNYGCSHGNDMLSDAISKFVAAKEKEKINSVKREEEAFALKREKEAEEKERISQGWHKEGDRWFTPEEWTEECYKTNAWNKIKPKIIYGVRIHVLRTSPRGSVCAFGDGKIFFCTDLVSSSVADDDEEYWNVGYWCGTYTVAIKDGTRTINEYTRNLDNAIRIIRRKFNLYNKGDKRFNEDRAGKGQSSDKASGNRCVGTGSGFFVSENIVVTCAHVVKGAQRVSCIIGTKNERKCVLVAKDDRHDLALLRVDEYSYEDFLAVERKPCKIADKVFTIGYPLSSMIGSEPKYSEGVVGAMNGLGGDVSCYQISVPVQPGNSGGPLLDARTGGVVGVVSARLSDAATVEVTGTVPQGINYAVKMRYVIDLLDANAIKYVDTSSPNECDPDVEFAKDGTVLIKVYE